jgi:1-acyl-sn-glycerol-3-phosphate acyltransferase
MNFLKATIKLIAFLFVTLFLYSLIMLSLLTSIIGVNYEKFRGYLLRFWGKYCCLIIGINIEVKGKIPEPPFLLVSNHLSYIDIFVLFSQLRCLFVAKSDVKTWPLIGFIVKTCGILFIDRNRKRDVKRVNEKISKNINEHQGIILFPEGTTSPGMDILPFRTSLLEFPASQAFPVSYVALMYQTNDSDKPAYETVCWWNDTPFFLHFFELLKSNGFTAKVHFGDKEIQEGDRKLLAEKLEIAIQDKFEPVINSDAFFSKNKDYEPMSF